jgi:hypothetical protein
MQGTILTFSIIAAILVLVIRPKYALALYISVLIWFPDYLRISIGTIDISIGRIVVTALLLRCLFNHRIRSKLHWSKLDRAVAYSVAVYVGVTLIVQSNWAAIENRAGFVMDTWFAYLAARYIITDKGKLISVIKCVSIVLVPMAILGCIEALTGWQPFVPLRQFRPWNPTTGEIVKQVRWGLTRAVGPFSHPILFGGNFAMFVPLIYALRHEKNNWRNLAYIFSVIFITGALSSMSSGPWVMIIIVLFCLFMERFRKWSMPMLKFFIFACIFVQIFSNRNFYHVLASYASMLGGAGWHRAKLIDVAVSHFGQWWLAGYGNKDPGWGYYLGMTWTDVTNEYILAGVRYGIAGVIALCWVLYTAFTSLITAYKKEQQPYMKSLYWALGSLLFAVMFVWMSVNFFGQLVPIFYCCLGMIGSCVLFIQDNKMKIGARNEFKRSNTVIHQETLKV